MKKLEWETRVLPIPHICRLELPSVDKKQFCCVRFNQPVVSTLFKSNLTLTKDLYAFDLDPDVVATLKVDTATAYTVQATKKDFLEQTNWITVSKKDVVAMLVKPGVYVIEPEAATKNFEYNIIDDKSNVVAQGVSDDAVTIDYTGNWIAFENLERFDIKFKVTSV